ncbi:MAG TPA: hypothetical protein VFO39_02195 [Candidatus Sulfotelmatobacter sp.]|nr:hypothetical protein [Candidatus Sulfotelmatobacter sp.]
MKEALKEIEKELLDLPAHFYGRVEISFQNGKPGLINITSTKKLSVGTTLGEASNDPANNRK